MGATETPPSPLPTKGRKPGSASRMTGIFASGRGPSQSRPRAPELLPPGAATPGLLCTKEDSRQQPSPRPQPSQPAGTPQATPAATFDFNKIRQETLPTQPCKRTVAALVAVTSPPIEAAIGNEVQKRTRSKAMFRKKAVRREVLSVSLKAISSKGSLLMLLSEALYSCTHWLSIC